MRNLIPHFIHHQYHPLKGTSARRLSGEFSAASLFVDISGFTALTETLMRHQKDGAEILTDALNRIFTPLVYEIYARGGFISTFAGDAFTALFPFDATQPKPTPTSPIPQHAVRAAYFIQQFFAQYHLIHTPHGEFELAVKIGLALGEAHWGIIHADSQAAYFFRGAAIDRCAQAEHHAARGEIVADASLVPWLNAPAQLEAIPDQPYYKLIAPSADLPARLLRLSPLNRKTLTAFVPPIIVDLDLTTSAEFRATCSVFIAFDEQAELNALQTFVATVLRLGQQHGGYFNKLDFGDKGGVMLVLFGAPVSYENDLERAANFLLALQRAPMPIRWRAGVTSGTAYAGFIGGAERSEYTAIGDPVNLAARLMMQAQWGEIWVSETVYARLRHTYQLEALGAFTFRGKSGTWSVYRLQGQRETAEVESFTGVMVGREAELAQLAAFVQPLFAPQFAGIAYIYGEAGMGKSRLAHELRQYVTRIRELGWFVCPAESILRASLHPFKHFLRRYFAQSSAQTAEVNRAHFNMRLNELLASLPASQSEADEVRRELERTRSFLAALVDLYWADSLYEQVEPKLRFENTLQAFKQLVKAESLRCPIVLVVEDLQWLDADSHELLKALTRNLAMYPIAVLITSRYQDDGTPFTLTVESVVPQTVVDLQRLSLDGVAAYAAQLLQGAASEAFVAFLSDKTNGNPFFVEQLVLHLRERAGLGVQDGAYQLRTQALVDIPSTINAVLVARLDRLTREIKTVVQTAAVLGREFEVRVLAQMLADDEAVTEKVVQAEQLAVWTALNEWRYVFKHALLRDVAYDMQLYGQLRDLHRLAGAAMEQLYADDLRGHYGDLAYHFEQAQDTEQALTYLELAGDAAKANYQNQLAVEFYARLLKQAGLRRWDGSVAQVPMTLRAEVLIKQGNVWELMGQWPKAETIYQEAWRLAQAAHDASRTSKAHHALGQLARLRGNYADALTQLEQALALCESLDDQQGIAAIVGNIGIVYRQQGDYVRAMAYYQRRLQISEVLGDTAGIAAVMGNLGVLHWEQANHAQAMAHHRRRWQLCEELGDKRGVSIALGNIGSIYASQGDYKQAATYYAQRLKLSEELGDQQALSIVVGNMGVVYEEQGHYTEALQYYQKSLKISEELGDQRSRSIAIGNVGNVHRLAGDYVQALDCYERALAIGNALGLKYYVAAYAIDKAETLMRLGRYAEAQSANDEGLRLATEVKFKAYVFKGQLRAAQLAYQLGETTAALAQLNVMLQQTNAEAEQAVLHDALWQLDPSDQTARNAHRQQAIDLYQALVARTPKHEWQQRLAELSRA
jgi:predicted ATPase/class 3 adenylate cyclase